ncbi:prephenate dehydrogenase [Hoyosella sp. G463]|uniref:Prephenate dehydrogenase n=2 Tax=Lolliginicoccus lacisalsi TaxID=2742202 RepID=A0A927JDI8_9ACTN|nr:prephenate dehydrogenase [Lolliginicoccus lacisalsi]MBD8507175.1 prephenate dehydrogenase [Lolliginicoccus lacisalsi]
MRAARAAGREVFGYNRSSAAVEAAGADGFDASNDLAATLDRAAREQALIVVAVPMPAVGGVLGEIARRAPGCPVTDVVSVKGPVAAEARARGLDARYVGGHPMAGTAESGWAAGDAALFEGATWVVSVDEGRDPAVWRRVAALALDCGAVVVPAASKEHDDAAARISHLPHVLAESLAIAGAQGGALALALAAGSFRDGTRVAGTAPALVDAMCEANSEALLLVLDEVLGTLREARAALAEHSSTSALTAAGHAARQELEHRGAGRKVIEGIVPGEPGWLEALREAGRAGAVLVALPGEDPR